jgi:septum formation protein
MKLILASGSVYRRALLERFSQPLQLALECISPDIDESPLPGESAATTALRLAAAKARAVAASLPTPDAPCLLIGSDQVAELGAQRLGKPGNAARACAQLRQMSGQTVVFHTALAVLEPVSGRLQLDSIPTTVRLRNLSEAEIERYVALEQPFDCAGSAKVEGLGISLLDELAGSDPTALIGLPLIALARMLRAEGVVLP